ncbi:uncharacterized protein G2W53_014446 [Senna tora]|uniref:Uncharacterized protein n=1 Tax=Senna tora TaxID=362788 RepID=A0A834WTJ8_9FABA|nr:uncharacterized protein G2W53_014446 [Senna tora]
MDDDDPCKTRDQSDLENYQPDKNELAREWRHSPTSPPEYIIGDSNDEWMRKSLTKKSRSTAIENTFSNDDLGSLRTTGTTRTTKDEPQIMVNQNFEMDDEDPSENRDQLDSENQQPDKIKLPGEWMHSPTSPTESIIGDLNDEWI